MKYLISLATLLLLSTGPQARATTEIMIKANHGRPEGERFGCGSCHLVMPTKYHKYDSQELTELGRTWVPAKKKKWWHGWFGK
jgi:hypothetical protein